VGLEEKGGRGGGCKVAPAVGALLRRESVPGIAPHRLGGIGGVDDGEAIAEEAVPFGRGGGGCRGRRRHRGFWVEDLEVEGEVPRQRLRVAAWVEEEAAVEAADLEIAAVEGAGAGAGKVREGPAAGGGGITAALYGESRRGGVRWRRRRVIGGGRRRRGGGGGSCGLHGLGIFRFVFWGVFRFLFFLGLGEAGARLDWGLGGRRIWWAPNPIFVFGWIYFCLWMDYGNLLGSILFLSDFFVNYGCKIRILIAKSPNPIFVQFFGRLWKSVILQNSDSIDESIISGENQSISTNI
jgi:hypothetical protein